MTSRRTVLKAVAAAGAAAAFAGHVGGLRAAYAAGIRTRRTLHGMSPDDPDLSAWRDFVGMMQGKDQSQLVSWLGYSLQHGDADGSYRYCPHGDWYFLPWHRAYVLMYERAVQVLTSSPNFAMPYWDWTTDRSMPEAYMATQYQGKPNPLYVAERMPDLRYWPLPDSIVGPDVMKEIFGETLFIRFGTGKYRYQNDLDMKWVVTGGGLQGTLESNPHNLIHNAIGGFMPSPGSPRDPIFFMHHGNIDRIWWWWNQIGNQNTAGWEPQIQTLWLDMFYKDNYITPDGKFYGVKTRDVQSTQALGYTYDKGFPEFSPPTKPTIDPARVKRLRAFFDGGATTTSVDAVQMLEDVNTDGATFDKPLTKRVHLPKTLLDLVQAKRATKRAPEVFAMLRDMEVPDAVSSVRVFVNADNLTPDTPTTDPHFVTEIGFLRHPGGHGGAHAGKQPPSTVVDLTPTLTALSSAGLLKDDTITLQIIAMPRPGAPAGEKPQVVPAAVEIAVL